MWAQNRRILVRGNNPTLCGKWIDNGGPAWGKQLRFCPWMNKQQQGRELEVHEPSAQSWESRISCVSDGSRFSPAIVKSTRVECACGWGLTVLPHPFLDNNCLNSQQRFLMKVVGNKTREEDTWVFSHWPRFNDFPTLILVKIMPLSHFSCCDRSWSGSFN